jgi:putative endonuclease
MFPKQSTQTIGKKAEQLACRYLEKHGLRLQDKNVFCRAGEIDLIMKGNDCLIFVEVRLRAADDYVTALESITPRKQAKCRKAALFYLQKHQLIDKVDCRMDVVAITQNGAHHDIQWIKNAF